MSGYRNTKGIDIDIFIDKILSVIKIFIKEDLISLEINPLFVYEKSIVAVDAIIKK